MAKGDACGVGFVGREDRTVPEQFHDRSAHLSLARPAQADDGLFDPERGVLEHRQTGDRRRRDRGSASRPEYLGGLEVLDVDGLLEGYVVNIVAPAAVGDAPVDAREALGLRGRPGAAQRPAVQKDVPGVAGKLDHGQPGSAQARIDSEHDSAERPPAAVDLPGSGRNPRRASTSNGFQPGLPESPDRVSSHGRRG